MASSSVASEGSDDRLGPSHGGAVMAGKGTKNDSGSQTLLRALLLGLLALVAGFGWLVRQSYTPPAVAEEVTLDRVYELATQGRIRSAKLLDEDAVVIGTLCAAAPSQAAPESAQEGGGAEPRRDAPTAARACPPPLKAFQASYPRSDVFTQQLIERMAVGGARVEVDKQSGTAVSKLLVTFLFPLLILANLFGIIFMARSGESAMSDVVGFGRFRRHRERRRAPTSGVTFADVGGAQEAVTELREVTDYLRDPTKFEAYGAAAPKGVLLFGPPGCGKTLMARAVAGEAGVPFIAVSGADFVESLVGVGAARVRDLFRQVRESAPAIVFIDEIDAVGRKRGGEGSTGGEREQTVNQLLVELDGFEVTAGIVLMGATNRPDILDPALLRPGRFDRHVVLEPPDVHGRQAILELHARSKPISDDVDFVHLARRTSGFTGADLANVINEGALLAIREEGGAKIDSRHLSEAVLRVLHGPQRRGKLMSPVERSRLAVHEAAHAVVAAALGQGGGLQRVSIVARGRGLGSSAFQDESERVLLTATEMRDRLVVAVAGIAAEELVFSESSTTSQDDIARGNAVAREMVGLYGMSAEVGLVRLLTNEAGYLGNDVGLAEVISGATLTAFDAEVKAMMEAARERATAILVTYRAELHTLAEALEDQETLEGSTLAALLATVVPRPSGLENNGRTDPKAVRGPKAGARAAPRG